ncbi:protein RALF-like 24 [Arachis stenosperma]|uniref:protein RALF-like 24 n=1 Tax=Arachis stenosperma TaxID=217475 RepID=UPI0025AB8539|nr:protein RALF-like 24 [Arachis stenosperma]
MYHPRFIILTFLYLSPVLLSICYGLSVVDLNLLKHSDKSGVITKRVCTKSIVECLEEETEMDSESNRRLMQQQQQQQHRYISYETLKRDMVPCDRAGSSYYSCKAREANPYNRGCEVITACARGSQPIRT